MARFSWQLATAARVAGGCTRAVRRFDDRYPLLSLFVQLGLIGAAVMAGPVWTATVLVGSMAAVSYTLMAGRPRGGLQRYMVRLVRTGLAAIAVLAVLSVLHDPQEIPWPAALGLLLSLAAGAVAGVRRRRRSPRTSELTVMPMREYWTLTGMLVGMHALLALLSHRYPGVAASLVDWLRAGSPANRATAGQEIYVAAVGWAGVFLCSQVMTSMAISSLNSALTEEWLPPLGWFVEDVHWSRYQAAVVPVVFCAVPSLFVGGALLAGVLVQVVWLLALGAFSDGPPVGLGRWLRRRLLARLADTPLVYGGRARVVAACGGVVRVVRHHRVSRPATG